MEPGFYVQSKNRLTPDEPWTNVFSLASSPRTLENVEKTFDFLNDRLGDSHALRIIEIPVVNVIKENGDNAKQG